MIGQNMDIRRCRTEDIRIIHNAFREKSRYLMHGARQINQPYYFTFLKNMACLVVALCSVVQISVFENTLLPTPK